MAKTWKLDDGLRLVRALQPEAKKFGYHVTLGGSVLNLGESEKDIDLYFLPLENPKFSERPIQLLNYLEDVWGGYEGLGEEYELEARYHEEDEPFRPPQPGEVEPAQQYRAMAEAIDLPPDLAEILYGRPKAKPKPRIVYQFKLKFIRAGGDRIDVFII